MIVHTFGFSTLESKYSKADIVNIDGTDFIVADGRYYIKWDLGRFTDFCYKVQEYMDYTDNPHTRPTERPIINNESLCAFMMVANVIDIEAEIEKVQQSLNHLQTFKNKLK
jgi:hypothetical protein